MDIMSVALSIRPGHLEDRARPAWYTQYCNWAGAMRHENYDQMMLVRPMWISEIMMREMPKVKYHMIKIAHSRGGLTSRNWPSMDLPGLPGVRLHVEYAIESMDYRCIMLYRTPTNSWECRFIITEKELNSAQGL